MLHNVASLREISRPDALECYSSASHSLHDHAEEKWMTGEELARFFMTENDNVWRNIGRWLRGTFDQTMGKLFCPSRKRDDFQPITNCQELQDIQTNLQANYELKNDIDCHETKNWNEGQGFSPIGDLSDPFDGVFNGNSYAISNLYISRDDQLTVGLFGSVGEASSIYNVSLLHATISANNIKTCTGILSGLSIGAKIENVHCTGKIRGKGVIGGLIGESNEGVMAHSHSDVEIESVCDEVSCMYVGGLLGLLSGGIVKNCHSISNIQGKNYHSVGGLVGHIRGGISRCFALGNVTGMTDVGGFFGSLSGDVSDSFAFVSVTGVDNVGGFGGRNSMRSRMTNTYAKGEVKGDGNVGGLLGRAHDGMNISFSYAVGRVNGGHISPFSGGAVGVSDVPIDDSLHYDTDTTGQNDVCKGTPKTTPEMKQRSAFVGWDFGKIWAVDENRDYPELAW
jgi:hypothetical protein